MIDRYIKFAILSLENNNVSQYSLYRVFLSSSIHKNSIKRKMSGLCKFGNQIHHINYHQPWYIDCLEYKNFWLWKGYQKFLRTSLHNENYFWKDICLKKELRSLHKSTNINIIILRNVLYKYLFTNVPVFLGIGKAVSSIIPGIIEMLVSRIALPPIHHKYYCK